MTMAEIVLRVRLISGEHLDVTYEDDRGPRTRSWAKSSRPSRKITAYCTAAMAAAS